MRMTLTLVLLAALLAGGLAAPGAAAETTIKDGAEVLPALKEVYDGKFDVGICVPRKLVSFPEAMAFASSQFNIVTPENELKPDAVLDLAMSHVLARDDETAVAVHFDSAKPLLDYAAANGLKVHGHVLVWHSQTPEALFHEGYNLGAPLAGREVMLGRMESYIRQVMAYMDENYPGLIVSWDVVNEAIDDSTGALRASPWLETIGEDYIARAFEFARKYAPEGTLLYYNDYNTAYAGKQAGIIRLLESLIPEGSIDGYGFQMHHALASPTMSQISGAVRRIAELGLRLRVSELDITVDSASEDSINRQARFYAQIMKLLCDYSDQVEAVQFWGLTDNLSWRASQFPLLFDADLTPKPAFWAVADPDGWA